MSMMLVAFGVLVDEGDDNDGCSSDGGELYAEN